MGRKVAIPWHASFSIAAGVLYFFFVLPRWPELMGDTTHSLGPAISGRGERDAGAPAIVASLWARRHEVWDR